MAEWREIKGYKYPYRISDQGEVQQYIHGRWNNLSVHAGKGRAEVRLRGLDGKQKRVGVFRLLDDLFRGGYARKHGLCTCPRNGVKTDCTLDNLCYKRQSDIGRESMRRTMRKPVVRYDRHGNTKLYKSVMDAARDSGLSVTGLDRRLHHGMADPRGYRWEVLR